MSRITPPVTKFTQTVRRISSTANNGRPSGLLDSQARNAYLPRPKVDLKMECSKRQLATHGSKAELVERLAAFDLVNSHGFHTLNGPHRPLPLQSPAVYRTIPLMQGFRTSAPKQAASDTSTIDFFVFPEAPAPPPENPFYKLRVPLLPDNYNPNRSPDSAHAVESLDSAVAAPEISIIASHPENVVPAALTEVAGNDGLDIDIGELTAGFSEKISDLKEPGVLKELWSGIVDDILGSKAGPKVAH
ncbi:hypothetical protein BGZ60DRAFT_426438 [Tricladium varicosporioides]|nr:hypothetical protein BGZ60DRAFT_426438 [Hymenoscyphus varicosporioides]